MKTEVYLFRIGNLYYGNYKLPRNIQVHCDDSYHIESKKAISVSMYVNLCKILEKKGHNVENLYFDEFGKPKMGGTFFSVSHSKKYYGFVIGHDELGFDVEEIIPENRIDGLAKTILTQKEKSRLEKVKDKQEYITERWCVKEGFGKLIGRGLCNETIQKDDAIFKSVRIEDTLVVTVFNQKAENILYFLDGESWNGKR